MESPWGIGLIYSAFKLFLKMIFGHFTLLELHGFEFKWSLFLSVFKIVSATIDG
jgi:hypothetical protein